MFGNNSRCTNTQYSRQFLHSAIVIVALSMSGSMSGCATTGNQNKDSELDLAKFATITTHAAVTNIEANYQTSDINELAVYAPSHYSTAGKAIEDAKSLLEQSQPREKIVQKVAVAEAVLRNGDRVMRKVKDILEPEITIKEKLDSLNTESTYGTEYGSLNERFNKLILEIEAGNTEEDLNREKLIKDMQQLERKALHFNAMNEPREILKRVKYRGGEKLAPITYGEAIAVFKRAEEFINKNPNYDVGITQIGREALFAAKRALYITEGVSTLKQKIEFAPEQIILDEEYRMYRVARQLAELDYRDNSLEVQSELLAKHAESISLELKNKDDLVIALRDTLIKVRDSSSQLTMLSDSTKKLKQEKNQWLAKEALFTAKVARLEEQLKNSEKQLDFTQQKLLAVTTENTQLMTQTQTNAQQTLALKNELANIKLKQKIDVTQLPADEAMTKSEPALTESLITGTDEIQEPQQEAQEVVKESRTDITRVEPVTSVAPTIAETASVETLSPKPEPTLVPVPKSVSPTTLNTNTAKLAEPVIKDSPVITETTEKDPESKIIGELKNESEITADSADTVTNKSLITSQDDTQLHNSQQAELTAQSTALPTNTPTKIETKLETITPKLVSTVANEQTKPEAHEPPGIPEIKGDVIITKATSIADSPSEEPKKVRAKITTQETLQAIISAKELITNQKPAEQAQFAQEGAPKAVSEPDFSDEDTFVDASE